MVSVAFLSKLPAQGHLTLLLKKWPKRKCHYFLIERTNLTISEKTVKSLFPSGGDRGERSGETERRKLDCKMIKILS